MCTAKSSRQKKKGERKCKEKKAIKADAPKTYAGERKQRSLNNRNLA